MKAIIDRAITIRSKIIEACHLSLYCEAGDDGVFVPSSHAESCYALYWTDELYSWADMVSDITADDIMSGGLSAITTAEQDCLISAAAEVDDREVTAAVVSYIKRSLCDADNETRQLACSAVEWHALSGRALEFMRGDIEAGDMSEEDVAELEKIV